jgi:thioredoxin-related protein
MVTNLARLKTLRSNKSFNQFIAQKYSVVVVYNYLCPACEQYLKDLRSNIDEFDDFPIACVHLNLKWMIEKAEIIGDVEEENTFLVERYGVGDLVPTTLFFKDSKLIKRVNGALSPSQLKNLINKTF